MMEEVIDNLCREIEKKLSGHGEVTFCAISAAREIQKSMAVSNLEASMSKVSLTLSYETDGGYLQIYLHLVDKLMSMHVNNKTDEHFLERLMDLVAAMSVLAGESVSKKMVERIVLYSIAILERVRKRAINFILVLVPHILEHFGEASSLVSVMEDAVIMRLKDKSKAVRLGAIETSGRFFNVDRNSEKFVLSLLWNLSHDPSAACRSSAVMVLPLNERTVEHFVTRVRDSEKMVRVTALQALAENLDSMSFMSTDMFAEIIRGGFSDRCVATKEAMLSLVVCNWIESMDFDLLQLLRKVDVLAHEDECTVLIFEIIALLETCSEEIPERLSRSKVQALKASFLRQKRMFVQSVEKKHSVEPEEIFLFRLAHFEGMDSPAMLPPESFKICSSLDSSKLCDQISRYSLCLHKAIEEDDENRQEEFTFHCFQLMHIAGFLSLSEEGSKRHFVNFIENFLCSKNTPDELVHCSISIFFTVHGKETNSSSMVYRILRRLSREVAEDSESGSWRTTRYLKIVAPTLESSPMDAIDEDLIVDLSNTITVSISNPDETVRELAVNCLGKLAFFNPSKKVRDDIKLILLDVALNEKEEFVVRSQGLVSLCDLAILSQEDSQLRERSMGSASFIHLLEELIWNKNPSIVALVGEISAKLLLDGRSSERKLLASLLAIYFYPKEKEGEIIDHSEVRDVGSPVRLQQLLSVFFPAFVSRSDRNRDALVESLHLALEYSSNGNSIKSLKQGTKFTMLKMTEYIIAISDDDSSGDIAISVCVQVARFLLSTESLSGAQCRAFCSFIQQQVLKTELEIVSTRPLHLILEDLQMVVTDEVAMESLSQVAERLAHAKVTKMDDSISICNSESSNFELATTNTSILVDSTNSLDCSNSKRYKRKSEQSNA